jgi:hypothetical protein
MFANGEDSAGAHSILRFLRERECAPVRSYFVVDIKVLSYSTHGDSRMQCAMGNVIVLREEAVFESVISSRFFAHGEA